MTFRANERNEEVKRLFTTVLGRLGHKIQDWEIGYFSEEKPSDPEIIDCYESLCIVCGVHFDITLVDAVDEKYALWQDHTSFRAIARAYAKYLPVELHINCDSDGRKLHQNHPCVCTRLKVLL